MLTVFAGLVAVIVATGVGFGTSGERSVRKAAKGPVAVEGRSGSGPATTPVPTTALIRGAALTTLFVTTTTPITTTTSTTTTTLPGPALDTGDAEVVFAPGSTSVEFTVRSSDPDGIRFTITGVPPGISVTPRQAVVAEDAPVTVTLKILDSDKARSGTLVLTGDDGSRVTVRVVVRDGSVTVVAVGFDPDPPVCGSTSRIVALVTGDGIASVRAAINTSGGPVAVALSAASPNKWVGTLPVTSAGPSIDGTVTAVGTDGTTASKNFSTTVADGPGCTR